MFNLNFNSAKPLYMQIVDQTKKAIAGGLLKDGDKFPSVRDLSKTLMINQSTVAKAFKEMDRQGIIETRPGVGSFIKIDKLKLNLNLDDFKKKLEEDFKEAIFLGMDKEDILKVYERVRGEINEI